jgi:hypothetical protein
MYPKGHVPRVSIDKALFERYELTRTPLFLADSAEEGAEETLDDAGNVAVVVPNATVTPAAAKEGPVAKKAKAAKKDPGEKGPAGGTRKQGPSGDGMGKIESSSL